MLTCPSGHPGIAGQRFCRSCGQSLADRCPAGHEVAPNATFCGTCGSPVTAQEDAGSIYTAKTMAPVDTIRRPTAPTTPAPPPPIGAGVPAPSTRRSRLALIVAAVAVLAVGGGIAGGIALTSHGTTRVVQNAGAISPGTTPPSTTAPTAATGTIAPAQDQTTTTTVSSQATSVMEQIASLLSQSASVRSTVEPAIDGVTSCSESPSDAEATLQTAISTRQQVAAALRSLDAASVPNGTSMVQALGAAMQDSVSADQSYVGWMQDVDSSGSCASDPSQDSSFESGQTASQEADTDKANFAGLWNAVAAQYGQQTVTPSQI